MYIPEISPSIPKPNAASMTSRYWKLPLNSEELVNQVKWASGMGMSISVNAPEAVTAELAESENKEQMMIHLLNYNALKNEAIKNIEVSLFLPEGKN